MLKKIDTKKAPAAIGPYSQAIVCGNMLFTSGQIPIDPATGDIHGADITEQAEQVMKLSLIHIFSFPAAFWRSRFFCCF